MDGSLEPCGGADTEEICDEPEDYYYFSDNSDVEDVEKSCDEFSEDLKCKTLSPVEVEPILDEDINTLTAKLMIPAWLSGLLLRKFEWNASYLEREFIENSFSMLTSLRLFPNSGDHYYVPDSPEFARIIDQNVKRRIVCRQPFQLLLKERAPTKETCAICLCEPSANQCDDPGISTPVSLPVTLLTSSGIPPQLPLKATIFPALPDDRLYGMTCGHAYCLTCWNSFFKVQIDETHSCHIECMESQCNVRVSDEFILLVLAGLPSASLYRKLVRTEMIEAHPRLKFCTNSHCPNVLLALEDVKAKRVRCDACGQEFCFSCGVEYHAPTDCETIKKWMKKCRDDSGTANYMAANTKDCPGCGVCIEKNGGCNHMQCAKCHHSFCWVCLGPWQTHSAQFYVCSKYRENADSVQEVLRNRARDYLQRYLFYFERWENHELSLRLEKEHYARIEARIQSKVLNSEGTWIDWQYLLTAAEVLRKCRYTLKFTYPYAYYPPKRMQCLALFEYQQALLEAEVEDLSWKIAHAEITDRGELLNKMNICEKHRKTLLVEFLSS